jgi:protein-tyrosine phosphatase
MRLRPTTSTDLGPNGLDANEVHPGLWVGALPPEGYAVRRAGFDAVVLCARQYQDGHYEGVHVLRCPLDDGGVPLVPVQWDRAVDAARKVAGAVKRGARVLVTCQMGINRSALVAALALRMLTGWSGAVCRMTVQMGRPGSLGNQGFVRQLEGT